MKIFVNGTFDIIHSGHIKLLNYAASLGDHLLVAIDTDRRVAELKGPTRPINNEYERVGLMINIKGVDQVRVFDSESELEKIIQDYAPDIMVKGSDYKDQPIVGAKYCKQIVFFDRIDEYSTTKKIQDIVSR
jgi:D-beta-D-heptose 7-phosphate kinase/D-beta-D-heptose 1-phosphate adenosyltransferase